MWWWKIYNRFIKGTYYILSKLLYFLFIVSYIAVRNTYAEKNPFDKYDNLISTKESPAKHGFGIRSIERVVNKYNGNMLQEFHILSF